MILNKYYIVIITIFIFTGCEDNNSGNCLNGIEQTIEATSYTEWKYFSVTNDGLIELDMTEDEAN